MKCPNCNETLLMTERRGVEIDYCPNCRGIWLDRGELDKILAYAEREAPPSSDVDQPHPDRPYDREKFSGREPYNREKHYDPYQKRRKHKSFLSDFFDFD